MAVHKKALTKHKSGSQYVMNDKLKLYLRRSLIYFVRFAHHKVFVLDIHTLSLLDCLLTEQDPIHTLISMFISINNKA